MVCRTNLQIRIERNDASRQPCENDFEIRPFGFYQCLVQTRLTPRRRQPLRHVIKRIDQEPDFVSRRRRQACVKIALRDRTSARHQVLDRRDQSARQNKRGVDCRKQAEHQYDRERQSKRALERLAQENHLLVSAQGILNAGRHAAKTFGHREIRLHHAGRFGAAARREYHSRTDFITVVLKWIEADKRTFLLHLQHYFFLERPGKAGRYAIGTCCNDVCVLAEQRDLAGTGFTPEHAEFENELAIADDSNPSRNLLGRKQVLALLNFEHGPTELEGAIEPFFDFNVKPRVNSLVNKLQ